MMRCPTCTLGLDFVDGTNGRAQSCPRCLGTAATIGLLRERLAPGPAARLWSTAVDAATVATRRCPACDERMRTFSCEGREVLVELDACRTCEIVWFDHSELERMSVHLSERAAAQAGETEATPDVAAETTPADRSSVSDASAVFSYLELIFWFLR